ncbi:MAG: hypothetical protein JNK05_30615 [Myxococcales bacterium]|nr:hypothetical protein [Myxococcales bacterium]
MFLDIDGVLNSDRYFEEVPWPEGASWWSAAAIDPRAVARVNAIVSETNARVVLSSSWRRRAPLDELCALLRSRGLEQPLLSATPSLYRTPDGVRLTRGDEVLSWLASERDAGVIVDAYVVLEDEEPLGEVEARCVRVDSRVGLTDADVARAIAALQR